MTDAPAEQTESRERRFLRQHLDPATTAVVTMELQNGIVGEGAAFPELVGEVERLGTIDVVRRLCDTARAVGAQVVHCTHLTRADGAGQSLNCRIFALSERIRKERGQSPTEIGSRGARLVDGLEDRRDLVVSRIHGLTPFTSTSLDQILRNLGVRTIVACGVSANVGVFGLVLNGVDLGYQVVVVRDAVAGVPADYARAVIDQSLSLMGTVVTLDDVLAVWGEGTVDS